MIIFIIIDNEGNILGAFRDEDDAKYFCDQQPVNWRCHIHKETLI